MRIKGFKWKLLLLVDRVTDWLMPLEHGCRCSAVVLLKAADGTQHVGQRTYVTRCTPQAPGRSDRGLPAGLSGWSQRDGFTGSGNDS